MTVHHKTRNNLAGGEFREEVQRFGTHENKTDYTKVGALPGDLPWYTGEKKKGKRVRCESL